MASSPSRLPIISYLDRTMGMIGDRPSKQHHTTTTTTHTSFHPLSCGTAGPGCSVGSEHCRDGPSLSCGSRPPPHATHHITLDADVGLLPNTNTSSGKIRTQQPIALRPFPLPDSLSPSSLPQALAQRLPPPPSPAPAPPPQNTNATAPLALHHHTTAHQQHYAWLYACRR